MSRKKTVVANKKPVARRFIVLSWRLRSSSRRTGGVDDPEPGTLLIPVVEGAASGASSRVRTSSMADGSGGPDVLIPATGGSYAVVPAGGKVTGRCLEPLMDPGRRRAGPP